jgi:predicted ATP-grasp superfamily ATP-dependent carboligase
MTTATESWIDISDTITRTVDIRELRRDLQSGRTDPEAILALLDALDEYVEKGTQVDDLSNRVEELEERLADRDREIGRLTAQANTYETVLANAKPKRKRRAPTQGA